MDKITKNRKLFIKLLKKVYVKKNIPNAEKHIKRLLNSVYPEQANDYIMIRINNYDFPVDAPLYPIVKYMNKKHGFFVAGWDAGMLTKDSCFITTMIDKRNKERNTQKRLLKSLHP
jgi:hypothetical protein